jgi:uncharacterized protein (DUF849 family)
MAGERPALIEVAINEAVTRDQHRFVPTTPAECAAEAIAAVGAGASFAHWHAPDLAAYAEAWRAMRAADVIAYPTYPNEPPEDANARLGHCFALVDAHGLEMAPLDLGTTHTVFTSGANGHALTGGGTLANPLRFLESAAARYRARRTIVNLASFDLGHTRLAVALARAGVLRPPLLLKIYLSDAWLTGPAPLPAALDLHLAQLPDDLEIHWLVVPFMLRERATFETLCRHALERGGGFRVGIGDNPGLFPDRRNAELVADVAPWIRASNRRVATTADVRRIFAPRIAV